MEYSDLQIVTTDPQVVKDGGPRRLTFKLQAPGFINEPVPSEFDPDKLKALRTAVEAGGAKWPDAMLLGAFLADALLPEPLRQLLREHLAQADGQQRGVRLRLMLTGNQLNRVPWEFLLLNDGGKEAKASDFLALRRGVSIVRHTGAPILPLDVAAPVGKTAKMAVALASPEGQAPLDVAAERATIEKAVSPYVKNGRLVVNYATDATSDDLPDRLQPADLFHFAGHGVFEKTAAPEFGMWEGTGSLVLNDDNGEAQQFSADAVATRLQNAGVRVAILGACVSAATDDVNAWASVAHSLVKANVGAVVAMQYNVRDDSAVKFAEKFYQALLSGLTIDEAVSAGRVAIMGLDDVRGWATPILFLRTKDGIVFPEYKDAPELEADRQGTLLESDQTIEKVLGEVTGINIEEAEGAFTARNKQVLGEVAEGAKVEGVHIGKLKGAGSTVTSDQKADEVKGNITGVSLDHL